MRDVINVKLDIVYLINHQLNETVRLSVSISTRNLYKSLKSIKENTVVNDHCCHLPIKFSVIVKNQQTNLSTFY